MKPAKIASIVLVLFLLLVCSTPYDAVAVSPQEPNLFELKGPGIEVTYSASSFSGPPILTYKDKKRDLTFYGDDIRRLESDIGLELTIVLEEFPDLHTVTFTLLLPKINLNGTEIPFRTYGTITTHKTSIGGPDLVKGPLQIYQVKALKGIARLVVF
jgi:hypothetical protein